MKYYKYIGGIYPPFTLNKIYPEDTHGEGPAKFPIKWYVGDLEHFQEVSEEEYLKQEGKMEEFKLPEKWYVRATRENEKILRDWRDGDHTGWSDNLVMLSDKFWANINFYKQC